MHPDAAEELEKWALETVRTLYDLYHTTEFGYSKDGARQHLARVIRSRREALETLLALDRGSLEKLNGMIGPTTQVLERDTPDQGLAEREEPVQWYGDSKAPRRHSPGEVKLPPGEVHLREGDEILFVIRRVR